MHPYVLEQLAHARRSDLAAAARQRRRPPAGARRNRRSARHLAGWTLIEIGLKLASPPGDA
jgi:hypothetical protein